MPTDLDIRQHRAVLPKRDAYIYLQRMGIDIWCPKNAEKESSPLFQEAIEKIEKSVIVYKDRAKTEQPVRNARPLLDEPLHQHQASAAQPKEVAANSALEQLKSGLSAIPSDQPEVAQSTEKKYGAQHALRFSLTVQEMTPTLFLLCELEDPLAPDLSECESGLLKGILRAVGKLENKDIFLSHNIFRWPVVDSPHSQSLFSDNLFAVKAVEGLILARLRQEHANVILLSDRLKISELNLPDTVRLYQFSSLAKMSTGSRDFKGQLWAKLQEILN